MLREVAGGDHDVRHGIEAVNVSAGLCELRIGGRYFDLETRVFESLDNQFGPRLSLT
jgi:hypothetical protein